MNMMKGMLGIKTSAEKQAEASAQQQQLNGQRANEQDAVQRADQQSASARLARAAGSRVLAFQGNQSGVPGGLSPVLGG